VIDPAEADGFRRSPWFNITGTDFIDTAFRVAHEVAPNAKLFINDFDTTNPVKRQFLFNLVSDLKSRGIPIDGVGHQMHNNVDYPISDDPASVKSVIDTINLFAGPGLDNQITEFDISVYSGSNPIVYTDHSAIPQDLLVKQGYRYRDYFNAFKQLQGKISSVTFWGEADDHTWLTSSTRVNAPLLFDPLLQHKYAYTGIIDPLDLPGADLALSMSADSGTVLTGHPVTYTITVTNHGHDAAANVSLTDTLPSGLAFASLMAPGGWTCSTPAVGGNGQISCTAASMDNSASAQFTLVANVVCPTPDGSSISNTAAAGSSTRDPNLVANNSATVAVQASNPPPAISGLSANPAVLWPPNHKMVNVALNYGVSDNCDASLAPVISITSNQPANSRGDGNTASDWQVIDSHHLLLLSERSGDSDRDYTITVTVTDSAGSPARSSVTVIVPHDARP
jgi:uncharacterized repeat protein (TIGR01451 family)